MSDDQFTGEAFVESVCDELLKSRAVDEAEWSAVVVPPVVGWQPGREYEADIAGLHFIATRTTYVSTTSTRTWPSFQVTVYDEPGNLLGFSKQFEGDAKSNRVADFVGRVETVYWESVKERQQAIIRQVRSGGLE